MDTLYPLNIKSTYLKRIRLFAIKVFQNSKRSTPITYLRIQYLEITSKNAQPVGHVSKQSYEFKSDVFVKKRLQHEGQQINYGLQALVEQWATHKPESANGYADGHQVKHQ
ncbi:Hypothetical_protein [Hexamita inflata]|uniref:Hypothetical_protein n=1 Tax=Hexamita inflata TaxID=28002 RepID=A0AA86PU75_9EUKA|nr:Hypothetical protein HINF_LOCUS33576 [Hexamita inflata]